MDLSVVIWTNIGLALATTLVGYLFGSIPTSLMVGKLFFKKDPRDYGSHNLGATNTGRVLGKKIGLIVIFLDALKLVIPLWGFWAIITFTSISDISISPIFTEPFRVSLGAFTPSQEIVQYYYLVALGCSIGHCFPLFAGLKGGKSVACLAGFMFFSNWMFTIVLIIIFFIVLCSKKYVSLASICAATVAALISWLSLIPQLSTLAFWGNGQAFVGGVEFASIVTLISFIVILRHRGNIKRLLNGDERKITWLDRKKKETAAE